MEVTERKWRGKTIDDMQYHHEVIHPNDTYYNRLVELQKEYPELTYDNTGYDKPHWLKKSHPEQLKEISSMLKESLLGFSEFNHFVVAKKTGEIGVRVQYAWSRMFTGVGYFKLKYWNEEFHAGFYEDDENS